ncbi:hypothetical protein [Acinetobacter sp. ANC 3813]|uniref:hypothetical protein n=1 Tax=Acinetobacter sp. ANC 3813 TaxID=1977873 RepID=UPI000A32E264|nr:hypothetical protein [Acinetobacter sp. ANC 3813]OTG90965.1 hypothetical protein B9T34_06255 [Acinetobacter sp. ANC 3813]
MMSLLFILAGVICLIVWPWVYVLYVRSAQTSVPKQYAMLFGPAMALLVGYFYYSAQQTVIRSQACGTIVGYQNYMSSGNKNKRQPFERVEIVVDHLEYSRHFRIEDDLQKSPAGTKHCFEYYDRKLNPQMQDSVLIRWLNELN